MKSNYSSFLLILLWIVLRKQSTRKISVWVHRICAGKSREQFTGEISPLMLQEAGIGLVMIGHSERRHVFGETDIEENKKVLCALEHGFKTLLCIGETAEEKEFGISAEVLRTQLKVGFHGVSAEDAKNIWVAYEPVWSIGVNGTPASADYAEEMHKVIKATYVRSSVMQPMRFRHFTVEA